MNGLRKKGFVFSKIMIFFCVIILNSLAIGNENDIPIWGISDYDRELIDKSVIWKNDSLFDYWNLSKYNAKEAGLWQKVEIDIDVYNGNDYTLLYTTNNKEPMTFVTGLSQVVYGIDKIVPSMKIGEIWLILIKPEAVYGKRGIPGKIPPDMRMVAKVKLLRTQSLL